MKVAIVGATGLVGQVMCQVLEERNFPAAEYYPVASKRSLGREVQVCGSGRKVISLEDLVKIKPDLALFSAGSEISREWAPRLAEIGCRVIDNSSAWRMDPGIKLIVPEVNASELTVEDMIIANPNCSTIQLVVSIHRIHKVYHIERMVISTYQSVTGTGAKAVGQYEAEKDGNIIDQALKAYPHPIFNNCLPHCDVFMGNGYTKEEMKLVNESRKILNDPLMRITATAVRVPVKGGHSESVNLELAHPFTLESITELISKSPGCVVIDDPESNKYPMPLLAHGNDDVLVGRIRRDESHINALNMWIVSDNLRKGAATNAIQIAEYLHSMGYLKG